MNIIITSYLSSKSSQSKCRILAVYSINKNIKIQNYNLLQKQKMNLFSILNRQTSWSQMPKNVIRIDVKTETGLVFDSNRTHSDKKKFYFS